MAEPFTVTLKIADNPIKGLPGQADYTVTISSEPDFELPGGPLPDPENVPLPLVVATEMIAHIAGMSREAAFIHVVAGGL